MVDGTHGEAMMITSTFGDRETIITITEYGKHQHANIYQFIMNCSLHAGITPGGSHLPAEAGSNLDSRKSEAEVGQDWGLLRSPWL